MSTSITQQVADIVPLKKTPSTDSIEVKRVRTREKILRARIKMLFEKPFFGILATRLRLIEVLDERIPTAATNGRDILYNIDFVDSLTDDETKFLFAHEVLHVALDHFGRTGSRDKRIANYAQDFVINLMLVDEGVGSMIAGGCYDTKYRDMSWEQVYDSIYNNIEKHAKKYKLIDTHGLPGGSSGKDTQGRTEEGELVSVNGLLNVSEAEAQEIKDAFKDAMLQAASSCKDAGSIPAGIRRLLDDMVKAKVDWKQLLRDEIQSMAKSDYSMLRPSRRTHGMRGAIMPGPIPESTIDVAIAIDMSGSIGLEDASVFVAEVRGMVDQYSEYTVNIWSFDTDVYNHCLYTQDSAETIDQYEPKGGGGTSFEVNFDFMKDNDIVPKKFIMFTDGYPGDGWGDADYVDTIFVVKGNTDAKAPFGQTIIYENLDN